MSKIGKSLLKGAGEALKYAQGNKVGAKSHKVHIPTEIDVREIREKLHMSRKLFSDTFGFSQRTLEKWEQGVRQPEAPTRAYLFIIKHNPLIVQKTLDKAA